MQRLSIRQILVVFLGGLFLGAVTLMGSTLVLLTQAEAQPINATVASINRQFWRSVHNRDVGVQWVTLADWGHDMVSEGPGLEPVPTWARPRIARPEAGRLRVGTLIAGWPEPWIGAWWSSNRRDEGWPPLPFDEDLGHGIEDAARRFIERRDDPTYFLQIGALIWDLIALSSPWWLMLGVLSFFRKADNGIDQPGRSGTST